jgi:hypothetical protein
MAKFFPDFQEINNSSTPYSEISVLRALKKSLSDDFYVYHSFSFIEKKETLKEGEADLVIFHKQRGLLILEIKGGDISIENGQWFSSNKQGKYAIKNPFDQARKAKHALLNKIHTKYNFFVEIGYGVCFPNSVLPLNVPLPMDTTREMILDSEILSQPLKCEKAIEKLLSAWAKPLNNVTADFIQHQVLAPTFRLIPNTKLSLIETDEQLLQLTQAQYNLLDFLEAQKQVLIDGSAGTGKTLLLLEKARRLAQDGQQVLILCFNLKLAEYLQSLVKNQENITIYNFHGLCEKAANLLNKPFKEPENAEDIQAFYDETAPEFLMSAIENNVIALFDAVLVDEGQDFNEAWWIPISSLVKSKGWFYIFYDAKQNLFARHSTFPITSAPYFLKENCRNTTAISDWLCEINPNAAPSKKGSPIGEKPTFIQWSSYEQQAELVKDCLQKLLANGYKLSDIVILTPYKPEKSLLINLKKEKVFSDLELESIMKFKGLEAPIVLLCDLGLNKFAKRPELLFTGASRARQLLFVFSHVGYPI